MHVAWNYIRVIIEYKGTFESKWSLGPHFVGLEEEIGGLKNEIAVRLSAEIWLQSEHSTYFAHFYLSPTGIFIFEILSSERLRLEI